MAFAERAELVARLSLKDDFSRGVRGVQTSLGGLERRFGTLGAKASAGLGAAVGSLAKIGTVAAGFISVAVKSGLQDLATLENATTSVDGAIKQVGLTGKVTSAQIAAWANDIESSVQAAFDDKAITQAATTLLRFGKLTTQNIKPALVVMTDLATKTGSVESAASLLAKALADPAKAAGKLARAGVILTAQQQKQIKVMVKAGDAAGAQKLLLDELSKATSGAAAASVGKYGDALNVLKDAGEDARKALAEGFLPVIEKIAGKLKAGLADPATLQRIRDFGTGLANAFDQLVDIGTKLPWAQIGDSLKIAGTGAKIVLDAFTNLPPWVQTAVLTGWGLNKLTGGMLGSIVGDIGKVVVDAFLGRGSSPANPLFVADVAGGASGGIIGKASTGLGAALGGGAALGFAAIAASAATLVAALTAVQKLIVEPDLQQQAGKNISDVQSVIATGDPAKISAALQAIQTNVGSLSGLQKVLYDLNADGVKVHTESLTAALEAAMADALKATEKNLQPMPDLSKKQQAKLDTLRDKVESNRIAIVSKLGDVRTGLDSAKSGIVGAVKALDLKPTVNVYVNTQITANSLVRAQVTADTYAPQRLHNRR
ncbi:MAG: hypothetical protein ABI678_05030 [Kofleriaceae bacterium]